MPKPQKFCIFCGGPKLSKEHLFADWLRTLFPRTEKDAHTYGEMGPTPMEWTTRFRQGHSGSKKVRTVCERCNSGWVSQIDDAARHVATPLIRGQHETVTAEMQRVLAAWFAKIATVGDSRRSTSNFITKEHRRWLMDQGEPAKGWQIYIGYYTGEIWHDLGIYQHGGKLDFSPIGGPEKLTGYVSTTTMGMGHLVALVVGWGVVGMDAHIRGPGTSKLWRIWPVRPDFPWVRINPLTDEEVSSIAQTITRMRATRSG